MIFVNHNANPATALVFEAAHYAAMAIDLHIAMGTHDISRQQDREIHRRTHRNIAVHREQHAIGRDILRLRRTRSVLRFHFHGKVQGKPRSTLHFCIVLDRSLLRLRFDRPLLLCGFA